ncbi:5-formyltetrahydrofolate cyclo-ligase [Longibacter salinarum]|uniref:5-formyltetrahydrofolate cyclo-ligase n=1 Tax=Longibacter salinarum TaxID=1850348 RepID=A0A2A8CUG6_9BACT|nr:5-formyltetrahydrofolate cyclo-ligase [Longibacter salinarum]PEN11394.1 5-formyltetrahydrofolate cyclo-ligase [Longibacter salinarum]
MRFDDKDAARQYVWDTLDDEGIARFPFPPHGRIPNFKDASVAAKRLFDHPILADAHSIKVNPDSPQRYVRIEALKRGIVVYVPTPRLRGGFKKLDPAVIPAEKHSKAASLSNMDTWAEPVDLNELPQLDAIVTGSVAVTRDGRRCGKGEGYSDLEYAILLELGHALVPVATTVHPLQLVEDVPTDAHDLPLTVIVTPDSTIEIDDPPAPPTGLDWAALTEADLEEMPILRELKR